MAFESSLNDDIIILHAYRVIANELQFKEKILLKIFLFYLQVLWLDHNMSHSHEVGTIDTPSLCYQFPSLKNHSHVI